MNSHLLSDGKIIPVRCQTRNIVLSCVFIVGLTACGARKIKNHPVRVSSPLVLEEVSLKPDSQYFKKVRKNTSAETKSSNDDLRQVLSFFKSYEGSPPHVRSRFQRWMRRKTEKARSIQRKTRTRFNSQATKDRKLFLANQKKLRQEFSRKTTTAQDRKEFFGELDLERKNFFAEQREVRKEMDANVKEHAREMNYNSRELRKLFNEEYRAYARRYRDKKKFLADRKRMQIKKMRIDKKSRAQRNRQMPLVEHAPDSRTNIKVPTGPRKPITFDQMDSLPGTPLRMGTQDQ